MVGAGFDGPAAELGGPGNETPAPPLPFKDPPMSVLLAGGVLGRVLLAGGVLGTMAGGVLGTVLLLAGGVLGTVLLPVRDPPVVALLGNPAVDPGRADPNDPRPTLVPAPATGCGRCPWPAPACSELLGLADVTEGGLARAGAAPRLVAVRAPPHTMQGTSKARRTRGDRWRDIRVSSVGWAQAGARDCSDTATSLGSRLIATCWAMPRAAAAAPPTAMVCPLRSKIVASRQGVQDGRSRGVGEQDGGGCHSQTLTALTTAAGRCLPTYVLDGPPWGVSAS